MMASKEYSIVEYYAEHEGYKCGYCKSTDSNYSHGMWAHSLTVDDYQELIDRGWRRSGRYCYKPTMPVTCCPMYTIRCEALDFKLSKSQKKVLKRVNRFLSVGDTKSEDSSAVASEPLVSVTESSGEPVGISEIPEPHPRALGAEDKTAVDAQVTSMHPTLLGKIGLGCLDGVISDSFNIVTSLASDLISNQQDKGTEKTGNKTCRAGEGADKSRPPSKKAKLVRLERRHEKLLGGGPGAARVRTQPREKTLEDFIDQALPSNAAHRLEVRLVQCRELESAAEEEFRVYRSYQMAVHGDSADKCTLRQYMRFLVNSPLKARLVAAGSPQFARSLPESRELFATYQTAVHGDKPEECNAQAFFEFLVVTPLEAQHVPGGPPHGYGSFHQQYWLDGRLIAVGVVDILPRCVSSVYFYYDPSLSHLSLGTYASLRELALTRSLQSFAPQLRYYYMGFYIDTCQKMRYKASYSPSLLLCPEVYSWVPIERCLPLLQASKYARLHHNPTATDSNANIAIDDVLVLAHRRAMPYSVYRARGRTEDDAEEVIQYATLVGMRCAGRMLLVRA